VLPAAFSVQAAETDRVPVVIEPPIVINGPIKPRPPTLECCRCLGGTNTKSLDTIPVNAWTVSYGSIVNAPVTYVTSTLNAAWNIPTGTAKWVSTSASAAASSGYYEYRLKFNVPNCTIPQTVKLTGILGADNAVEVYLDSVAPPQLITSCGTPNGSSTCFTTPHSLGQYVNGPLSSGAVAGNPNPLTISANVTVGSHTLIVKVYNDGGVSGMFVNAKLTGTCTKNPIKGNKDIPYYPTTSYDKGKLTINAVDVNDGFGGSIKYSASMTLQPSSNPLTFILDQAEQIQPDPVQQCVDNAESSVPPQDPSPCYLQ
jgi:hypothetical protein